MRLGGRPPELERIAEAVRDREWLDLRVVELGMVGRACPMNITVWPDRDDVTFRQEYILNEKRGKADLVIDAEDIMWVKPTALKLEDVEPPILPAPPPGFSPSNEELAAAILEVVAQAKSMSVQRVKESSTATERKLCIRLMWELCRLNQTSIPQFFGYSSGGMTTNALDWTQKHAAEEIADLHKMLERRYGHQVPRVKRPSDEYLRSPRPRLVPELVTS